MKITIDEQDLRNYLQEKFSIDNIVEEIKKLEERPIESVRIQLSELNNGDKFQFGGISWVRLYDNKHESLCLSAENVTTEKEFDKESCNDWRESSLRGWLNNDFLGYIYSIETDAYMKKSMLKITSNLTADCGMDNYGVSQDFVALLSCGIFRKYRKIIPNTDNWYWTLTPWSCDPDSAYVVRTINTSGNFEHAHTGNIGGIRPLIGLTSETLVTVIE